METLLFVQAVVPCGFPSPAADQSEEPINLQDYLVRHKASTCCVRCGGDSMIGSHIVDGDILVVDRQIRAQSGDIVLAIYDGAFVIKRFFLRDGHAVLHAENASYRDIIIQNNEDLTISGVVVGVVRKYQK